jgi:hypothetical protein
MADNLLTVRILREIQSELGEMREGRADIISFLGSNDGRFDAFSAALRGLISEVDDFRNEMRERLTRIEDALHTAE